MKLTHGKFLIPSMLCILLVIGFAVYAECTGTVSPVRYAAATALAPVQKSLTGLGDFVEDVALSVVNYQNLEAENTALRARISDYESRVREADLLIEENASLRELLNMKRRYAAHDMLPAEVIASEMGAYGVTYTLDCGTDDGVAAGNAVLVWEGMAGVVTAAGPNWCEMVTVLDADFSAGVMISRNHEAGVAQGDPSRYQSGELLLAYLPQESGTRQNDRIVTSGLGGVYPPNLLIGRVSEIWQEENGLSYSATVKPAADLTNLRRVFIVTGFMVSE